jgi:hypothetical protein
LDWRVSQLAETGAGIVVVFREGEDGDGFVEEEGEAGFEGQPFVFIDLDGELLGAAVMAALGRAALFGELAEFFAEGSAFFAPWNQDGVGGGVDEAEFLSGSFEFVGKCPVFTGVLWLETGVAGDDALVVPVFGFFLCLPDGLLADDRRTGLLS